MARWFYSLALFVPAALAAALLALSDQAVFALSAIGLVPMAALIGRATEELARHLGARFGGMLNATFGNAAELILTLLALKAGLLALVKASITGSILGNTLLVLGMSLVVGGLHHGSQRFDPRESSRNAAMLIIAVAGLYVPAAFATTLPGHAVIQELSLFVAGALLATYLAYLAYTVFATSAAERPPFATPATVGEAWKGSPGSEHGWPVWKALGVLGLATAGALLCSELLVATVEPVAQQIGWTEFFVGVILVPIIGNAAEHFSALLMAWRNRVEATLAITAGSSAQIALFVAPVLVFASLALGHPLNLIFTPLEAVVLGLATAIFAYISLDGESNWLEGVQLLALYAVGAFAFFFLPAGSQ